MCTLALSVRPSEDVALIVAANRDESLARPSDAPFVWADTSPRLLAPRDRVGGGSWLGLNAAGLFVAITNRFGVPKDPTRVSRGLLVLEALKHASAESLHATLAASDVSLYSPFHLAYADARRAFVTGWTGESRLQRELEPGLHVFTERSFGAADDSERVEHFRRSWPREATVESVAPLLREHNPDAPFDAPCVHAPAFSYGTRSSFTLSLASRREDSRMRFTEGPPCESVFQSGDGLLKALWS